MRFGVKLCLSGPDSAFVSSHQGSASDAVSYPVNDDQ